LARYPAQWSRFLTPLGMTAQLGMREVRAVFFLLLTTAAQLSAQNPPEETSVSTTAVRLASIAAVTGYERTMVNTLLRLLPGASRDRAGNAILILGAGKPKRLAVCPLDEPGYVVGGLREDGYLTLRRVPGRVSPLFDQQLEGHRVTIHGRRGPVPGVVAVRSVHLTRGRGAPSEAPFTVDDAYVDVGAGTKDDAAALGVNVLSPVTLTKRPHAYGQRLLAAPAAGRRAACAALVTAARSAGRGGSARGTVVVALVVEQELAQRGLATVANALGAFDETVIVDGAPGARGTLVEDTDAEASSRLPRLGSVTRRSLPVSHAGTVVETVSLTDADSLQSRLVRWVGGSR
jgi:putative aminopeptidase FrvX